MQFITKIVPDQEVLNTFLKTILLRYEEDDSIEIHEDGLKWIVVYRLPEEVVVSVDLRDVFEGGFPKACYEQAAFDSNFLPGGVIAVEGTTHNSWSGQEDFVSAIWDFLEDKTLTENQTTLSPTCLRLGPKLPTEYETSRLTLLVRDDVNHDDLVLSKEDLKQLTSMVESSPLFFLVEEDKLFVEVGWNGCSLVGCVRKDLVVEEDGTISCSREFARNLLAKTGDSVYTSIVRLPILKRVVIKIPKGTNEQKLMNSLASLKCLNVDSFLKVEEKTQTFKNKSIVFVSSITDWEGSSLKVGSLVSPKEITVEVVLEEL